MSIRWRATGELLCAAKCDPMDDDTYIDDRLHYQLSVLSKAIVPDANEASNGSWWWLTDVFVRAEVESLPKHASGMMPGWGKRC